MAENETNVEGGTIASGNITLILNPPTPEASGEVSYEGAWVRAELDGDKLTVVVRGQASYAGRTSTSSIDLDLVSEPGLAPLAAALQQILDAYGPMVRGATLDHAYRSLAYAKAQGEVK